MAPRTHTLYRFFDAAGQLLYIGLTCDPGRRLKAHSREKSWWENIAQVTLEQHPDRESLESAERSAIRSERPLYNVVHNRQAPEAPLGRRPEPQHGYWWGIANPPIEVGAVVAIGISDSWGGRPFHTDCHVGLVTEIDVMGTIDLTELDWMTGIFGGDSRRIAGGEVDQFLRADLLSDEASHYQGWNSKLVGKIYDCDALAEFRSVWMAAAPEDPWADDPGNPYSPDFVGAAEFIDRYGA